MAVKGVAEGADATALVFHPLTLRFKDKAVERRFNDGEVTDAIWIIRLSLFFAALLVAAFGVLDYYIIEDGLVAVWLLRFGVVCPTLIGALALTFTQRFVRCAQLALSIATLAAGLGIVGMIAVAGPPANEWYYAGLILVVVYASTLIRLRFLYAAGLALLLVLTYQGVAVYVNPIPFAVLLNNDFFLLTTVSVGLFASYALEFYARRDFVDNLLLTQEKLRSEELMEKAQAANHAKSEFLASVSHELRTPLNAVIGFSEILMRQLLGPIGSERYRNYAEDIHNSSRHLLNIINDILDLSKAEANKLSLSEEEVGLNDVMETALGMVRGDAARKGVKVSLQFPEVDAVIVADRRLLSQLIINLASNAVKFTPENGGVVLSVSIDVDEGVLITVADNGVGIAEEDIPRVLEPFVQVESAESREHGGTGLGLPLAKKIAELHDAAFTLESELGRGTIVKVLLPASRILRLTEDPSDQRAGDAA